MPVTKRLKIGEISRQTGVAVGALRYYDSLGLLQSGRGENGYRYYPPETVRQVQFIKKAQALGFSLADIRDVLQLHHQGDVPCAFVQSLLEAKIDQLNAKIQQMVTFKAELEQSRDRWLRNQPQRKSGEICPLIEMVSV